MSNPFFDLQSRLVTLLRAHAYFTALPADAILTEQIGDIDNKVLNDLLPLGFGVVITTAKGEAVAGQNSLGALASREMLIVTLIHNPTTEPAKSVLDALAAAIAALHGQPVVATRPIRRPDDALRVTGHERRTDAPPELHVHHLLIEATLHLS